MTRTLTIAPVRKSLLVNAPQDHAFDVFTEGIDRWWPKSHSVGSSRMRRAVIEPRVGGRWYEIGEDGSECKVGTVLLWEPPQRLIVGWQINSRWQSDENMMSEVEVRFTPKGARTLVELEHRNFEVLGPDGGASMRESVNSGWPGILELFANEAAQSTAEKRK